MRCVVMSRRMMLTLAENCLAAAGRGSENKVPFVAAISPAPKAVPCFKMAPVPGFTRKAVFDWTSTDLALGCIVTSDGLGCFAGVTDAGCQHRAIVADGRKPKEFQNSTGSTRFWATSKPAWVALPCIRFRQIGTRYLGAFVYRFNRRFHLEALPLRCSSLQPLSDIAQHVGSEVKNDRK